MDNRDHSSDVLMDFKKMRTINVIFADEEFEQLDQVKMKSKTKNWRTFILELAGINNVKR